MTAERWQRVKAVFQQAEERGPEQRDAFLAEACGADGELRREVERMLRHSGGEGPLDTPAWNGGRFDGRLAEGAQLGPYQILAEIGAGGMGTVYKARDQRLGRTVAIKISSAEFSHRFQTEARAISALNHPHVCALHDIGEQDGISFLVMEYVEGESLAARLRRGCMPVEEVVRYGAEIADALSAAHAQGMVHRDLKPANIMLTKSGVKVLDFGLALMADGSSGSEPQAVEAMGTLAYMSPEQLARSPADERSDIFALGLVLYEMASGRRAFAGDSHTVLLQEVWRADPPPLADVPPELARLIGRCLQKQAAGRVQKMNEVCRVLEGLKGKRHRPAWIWLTGLAAVLVLAIVSQAIRQLAPRRDPMEGVSVVPLTNYTGNERDPNFSPGGDQLAFAWNGGAGGRYSIYVKAVGSSAQPTRLTRDGNDFGPAWSPDGKQIAFRRTDGGSGIYMIPSGGGPARRLAQLDLPDQETMPQMSWSRDGKWLASPDHDANGATQIYLFPVNGGPRRQVTFNATGKDNAPAFSPDGKLLAYASCAAVYPCDIFVRKLGADQLPAAQQPRRVTSQGVYIRGLAWMPDSRRLVYAAGQDMSIQTSLWRVWVDGLEPPQRMDLLGTQARHPAVSPAGGRLAYTKMDHDANIWRIDRGGKPEKFISTTLEESDPDFSPDGGRIAFCSNRSGLMEIWKCHRDGTSLVQLSDRLGRNQSSPRWAPDGQSIAFDSEGGDGHTSVYTMDADGGNVRRVTLAGFDAFVPSWSRDGNWIYYSRRVGVRAEIWRTPARGGTSTQVTDQGGFHSSESADGKWLYYTKEITTTLLGYRTPIFVRPVAGGPERLVVAGVTWYSFALAPEGIFYLGANGGDYQLSFYDLATGRTARLASVSEIPHQTMTASPDGQTILYGALTSGNWDLMLVEGFR